MKKVILSSFFLLLSHNAIANETAPIYPNPQCLLDVTKQAGIPFTVFLAIMKTEGGKVGLVKRNRNGSHDLGVMQVNDQAWLRRIAIADFDGSVVEARKRLIWDGCYSMKIGSLIYRNYIDEAISKGSSNPLADAVGHYNSHTPDKARRYMRMVAPNFRKVLRDLDSANQDSLSKEINRTED